MRWQRLAPVFLALPLLAHDARPLSVVITEQAPHVYRVNLVVPPSVDADDQPTIEWPAGCQMQSENTTLSLDSSAHRQLIVCANGLEKQHLHVHYPLFNPSLATFFRLAPIEGEIRNAVLPPQQSEWIVPATPNRLEVAGQYWMLGIEHILKGVDHLLFVLGLLLLAGTTRRIILAITGFSVAHSITLSLSALGFVHMPIPPTEAAIALSIMFLASEIVRGRQDSITTRYPLLVSAAFGLLHGLGFAAALGEIGLPPNEIPTSLLFFSIGVETGQMLFILPVIGILRLAAKLPWPKRFPRREVPTAAAYAIGIVASFWFIERVKGFWG